MNREKEQANAGYGGGGHNARGGEPVFALAPVEHELQCGDAKREQDVTGEGKRSVASNVFTGKVDGDHGEGGDTEGNDDKERSAPAPLLDDVAAKRRAEEGPERHAETPQRDGFAMRFARMHVEDDGLAEGDEKGAEKGLDDAQENDLAERFRQTAQEARDGEYRNRHKE